MAAATRGGNSPRLIVGIKELRRLQAVDDAARDLVLLWTNPKIQAMARSERNATIEHLRDKLIKLYGMAT